MNLLSPTWRQALNRIAPALAGLVLIPVLLAALLLSGVLDGSSQPKVSSDYSANARALASLGPVAGAAASRDGSGQASTSQLDVILPANQSVLSSTAFAVTATSGPTGAPGSTGSSGTKGLPGTSSVTPSSVSAANGSTTVDAASNINLGGPTGTTGAGSAVVAGAATETSVLAANVGGTNATSTPGAGGQTSATATATTAPGQPTATATATLAPGAPTATATTAVQATSTQVPPTATTVVQPTATNTVVVATNTPIPTNTSVPPTATSVPPTATQIPPTATNTPVPTANPQVSVNYSGSSLSISLSGYTPNGQANLCLSGGGYGPLCFNATVPPSGAYQTSFSVSLGAYPGTYSLVATDRTTGKSASDAFSVQ